MTLWQPRSLARRAPRADLWWIVVDELREGVAGLVACPWPEMDARGRLVLVNKRPRNECVTVRRRSGWV